jgi:hypothetical protein
MSGASAALRLWCAAARLVGFGCCLLATVTHQAATSGLALLHRWPRPLTLSWPCPFDGDFICVRNCRRISTVSATVFRTRSSSGSVAVIVDRASVRVPGA